MNNRSVEVNARLTMANRAYYGLQNHMKSRIITRNTKTLLYKTFIIQVLTYWAETWVLSKQDEHRLSIFERTILRRIYGPVMDWGRWRIRTNQELYQSMRWEWHCEILQVEKNEMGRTFHMPGRRWFIQESPPQWARRKAPQRETQWWSGGRCSKARV
jgi:hypothetical protein